MDAMLRNVRWIGLLLALALLPLGCVHEGDQNSNGPPAPRIRVRLLEDADRVALHSIMAAHASLDNQNGERFLSFPKNADLFLTLQQGAWHVGNATLGSGTLTIRPGSYDDIRVNGLPYRGVFRFIPLGAGRFDVVNDLNVDEYLQGVVPAEMYRDWHEEAYKAQAIASRTYALFEARSAGVGRTWDVYPDERSQMYGGIRAETSAGNRAVEETAGIVLTYGPGNGKIFKSYFSSCCGGISQASVDAFGGEAYIMPLSEQHRGTCCSASKYFNWGPITVKKEELARRFRIWASRQAKITGHPLAEESLADVYRIDTQSMNRYARPTRVLISDSRGTRYSWTAEQFRAAVNTDAPSGATLPSSFCKINGNPNSDSVTFFDGHGFGHGVGMCQWCAEAKAAAGWSGEQILAWSYPQAKIKHAY
jgi:stage II sporulation protein D